MKSILLCASGLTPQIITETLYVLAVQERSFIPDEIHVLTTREGKNRIQETLLDKQAGQLHRFLDEYDLMGKVRMDNGTIHLVGPAGGELIDIRCSDENILFKNRTLEVVRNLIESCDRLHASLAGGRKSMGFYLGMAMQLLARPQDELSHILVNPPFDNMRDFYYPPKEPRLLRSEFGGKILQEVSSSEARLELARLSFVRLRGKLGDDVLTEVMDFDQAFQVAQREVDSLNSLVPVAFNTEDNTLAVGEDSVKLAPREAALYWALLKRREACSHKADTCHQCSFPLDIDHPAFRSLREDVLLYLQRAHGQMSGRAEQIEASILSENPDDVKKWFSKTRTLINGKLKSASYGFRAEIRSERTEGTTWYSLGIDSKAIDIR